MSFLRFCLLHMYTIVRHIQSMALTLNSIFPAGILILVSQRAEVRLIELLGTERMKMNLQKELEKQRGNGPTFLEWHVLFYVFGR